MERELPVIKNKFINALVFFAGININGCTHTVDFPAVHFSDYQTHDKVDFHLALRLSDDFRNAKSVRAQGFETFIVPLGGNLTINAEILTRAIFTEVTVLKENDAPLDSQIRAILIPRIISSARVSPISSFIKQIPKIVVVLEWALRDREDNLIWIDTITAEGKVTELGNSVEENRLKLTESLVRDLFGKSYDAFLSAPEIRKLSTNRSS